MKLNEPGTLRKVTPELSEKEITLKESFEEFVDEMRESSSRSEWKESVTVHSSEAEMMLKQEFAAVEHRKGFETHHDASIASSSVIHSHHHDAAIASSSVIHSHHENSSKLAPSSSPSAPKQPFVSHSTVHLKRATVEKHDGSATELLTDQLFLASQVLFHCKTVFYRLCTQHIFDNYSHQVSFHKPFFSFCAS